MRMQGESHRAIAYRKFLQSKFWKSLAAEAKNGKTCAKCSSSERLQAHHRFYRSNWYDTTIDDLVVLCRRCHAAEHGLCYVHRDRITVFPYTGDLRRDKIFRACHLIHQNFLIRGFSLLHRHKKFIRLVKESEYASEPPIQFQLSLLSRAMP